jgi:ATP-dependent Zn protease
MGKLSSVVIEGALRQRTTEAMIARLAYATKPQIQTAIVTLDDVHGQDAAVSAFRRMLEDIERWRAGEVDWADLVMSAVLYGPPGNGKTMLADALAGSAGVPCISTSYSECQAFGHQGEMLKALKQAFQQAADEAPSVLFIDEIDSFSARDSDKHNDGYIRGVVNGLLTEISRAVRVPGLMLLAATNDLSVVDPAVIRPGRFDLRIPVMNPDLKGIKEILLHHLGVEELGHVDKDRLQEIVRLLAGTSGAGVAAIARQALGAARSAGRQVCLDDVITVASVDGKVEDRDSLYRCAIHESGHAMVRLWSALPNPTRVLLTATGGQVESRLPGMFTASTATEQMRCLLAGRAAEIVCLGDASSGAGVGHDSDLAVATSLALRIDSEWHLEAPPSVWMSADVLITVGISGELKAKVAARVQRAEAEAVEQIQAHKEAVVALAEHLMVVREMNGDELVRFLGGYQS